MSLHLGIAGAGLLGRLAAWRLARLGHRVAVFDPAEGPEPRLDGQGAAGFSAAGMLSPLAERDVASERIAALGWRSIGLWREIVAALPAPPAFATHGSLLLAHRADLGSAQRLLARLPAGAHGPQALSAAQLTQLEPSLRHTAAQAWLLPGEGHIDAVQALRALHAAAPAVHWHWRCEVTHCEPGALHVTGASSGRHAFDAVFDLRGLGARRVWPLRGVRGETAWLQLPGHGLTRPVRLVHPRHRVYLVPRAADTVLVGASEIESEDRSEVSLKSAVELMAAAHSVLPALQEARILRLDRNLRPALPDHEPRVEVTAGLVRINGLFRHGWLLAPALLDDALRAWAAASMTTATSALTA